MKKEEMKKEEMEMETEVINDEDVIIEEEGEEEMKKDSLITKGKNFITKNKKKILAVGLTVVGGVVGYALGSKGSGVDYSPLEDTSSNEVPTLEDHSDSEEVETAE